MAALRIYTNESVALPIVTGLQQRGVTAWSARDAGNLGLSDEEQLEYACRQKAAVLTYDDDFLRIAHQWTRQPKEHWGVIFAHAKRLSIGQCILRLARYARYAQAEDLKNRVIFL